MKVSIIGAGNVGGLLASRIIDSHLADVTLIDIKEDIAKAKAADISDSLYFSKSPQKIIATSDINQVEKSEIIVITAGFPRRAGMSREDLIAKNANLIKEIATKIKSKLKDAIVIIVTNPLDLMVYYFKKLTQIDSKRLIGMGNSLDSARFANLIASKFDKNINDINAQVIASHGRGMLPLDRLTYVKDVSLAESATKEEIKTISDLTVERGAEIVSLYGSGSAYFAPSAAIFEIVKAIAKDEKKIICAAAYLKGEYGISDICLGVPAKIGKSGIEEIITLALNKEEEETLRLTAQTIKELTKKLPH
ncbi:MAG: malate dehydrogenase [Candidatus Omnitrophica bacterium]|nr:malate dehydrogenase [Candidatus Omnitrophota bacterium]